MPEDPEIEKLVDLMLGIYFMNDEQKARIKKDRIYFGSISGEDLYRYAAAIVKDRNDSRQN